MDSARATTTGTGGRLIHCSPDRTLVSTLDATSGAEELRKLFERGSLADAEREVAMATFVQHLDVVRYLGADLDPVTSRPCVRMQLVPGRELGQLVADDGALPAALVCRIGHGLARTLAGMHALRRPELPRGLCHGDVKPTNVMWDGQRAVLLDLEHAAAIGDGSHGRGYLCGTEGFRAPETEQLSQPTAAFDVFALGATLRWLLDGGDVTRGAALQPAALQAMLCECTDPEPSRRPTAAALAERLERLRAECDADPDEPVRRALQSGLLDEAEVLLQELAAEHADAPALRRLLRRRRRLLGRRPHCLVVAADLPGEPAALHRELRLVAAALRRFPAHAGSLQRRTALRHAVGHLLTKAVPRLMPLLREEEFAAAGTFLSDLRAVVSGARELPGGLPVPFDGDPRMPALVQRQPLQFLAGLKQDLEQQQEDHEALFAELEQAEAEFDVAAAEQAIERIAAHTGGTTGAVIRRRDRLHRLVFWLERLARARRPVDRLGELAPAGQPELRQLLAVCSERVAITSDSQTPMGLRSLQLTLQNLADEFPRLHARLQPCRDELALALVHTSDEAWALLAKAQEMLRALPVPVRPLQTLLHRLDGLRLLEAVVDRPQRPRSHWLDQVEGLRTELEQARATRDRLAHGAELAMARGHWTTGLFEMERAVTSVDADDDNTETARRLHERLDVARRKKRELEAAMQRNVALGARFAGLLDAPDADCAERLRVLRERRDCLQFLIMQVPQDRGELYARDLREVETLILVEQAADAEARLDHTDLPTERLQLARATLLQLSESPGTGDAGNQPPGRIARLQEHWRHLAASSQREVELLRQQQQQGATRRRRRHQTVAAACTLLLLALALGYFAVFGGHDSAAATSTAMLLRELRPVAAIAADQDAALRELRDFATGLDAARQGPALGLVDAIATKPSTDRTRGGDPLRLEWLSQLHAAVGAAAAGTMAAPGLDAERLAAYRRFVAAAWRTGLVLAALAHPDSVDAIVAAAEAEQPQLRAFGVELPADLHSQLSRLQH